VLIKIRQPKRMLKCHYSFWTRCLPNRTNDFFLLFINGVRMLSIAFINHYSLVYLLKSGIFYLRGTIYVILHDLKITNNSIMTINIITVKTELPSSPPIQSVHPKNTNDNSDRSVRIIVHRFNKLDCSHKLHPPVAVFTRQPRSVEVVHELNC